MSFQTNLFPCFMIKSILKTVEPAYNHNAAGHIISMSFEKKKKITGHTMGWYTVKLGK